MGSNTTGYVIKGLRKGHHLTQSELAERIGKKLRTVQKYENGTITPPLDVLEKIAAVFNVTVADLIGDEADHQYESDLDSLKALIDSGDIDKSMAVDAVMLSHFIDVFKILNKEGKLEAMRRVTELIFMPEYRNNPEDQ